MRKIITFSARLFSTSIKQCYYDWSDDRSYWKAVEQQYFLRDIVTGYQQLKRQPVTYFNQDHITFMAYLYCLFPEEGLLEHLKVGFMELEQKEQMQNRTPRYIQYIRSIGYSVNEATFRNQLVHRINAPKHFHSLLSIKKVLMEVGYENMGGLFPIYSAFKKLFYELILQTQYKMDYETVNHIIQIHHYLVDYDKKLLQQRLFIDLPEIYMENQTNFQNMIKFLQMIFTKNFLHIANKNDILAVHKKICHLKKFNSSETKQILRRYAEHIAISNFDSLIIFRELLNQ